MLRQTLGNLNVTTKLTVSFGIVLALTIAVSYTGIHASQELNDSTKLLLTQDLAGISAMKEAGIFQVKYTRALRDEVLALGDKDAVQDNKDLISELDASVDEWIEAARKALPDADSQAKIREIKRMLPKLRVSGSTVLERVVAGDRAGAMIALKETNKPSADVNLTIAEICRSREAAPKQAREKCEAVFRSGRAAILIFAAFAVVFGLTLCLVAVAMIAQPLTLVMKALQDVSKGDLTRRLFFDRRDEIGQIGSALNQALESTRSALEKANDTAEQLGAVSVELLAASEELASGSKTQAEGLDMAATSIEELTATARSNTDYARHANGVSAKTRELAQGGHQVVADAETAMEEINTSSEKISQIVDAVNEVAFKTNMLALNAAIEAALAGQHGKSFAVVATEIRELSQSSADCANGIRSLVDESVRTAQKGAISIQRSGATLKSLAESVQEVAELVGQIMNTSEKQTLGVEHVNTVVSKMGDITAANSEQASKLHDRAVVLSNQATLMHSVLSRFKIKMPQNAELAA